MKISNLKIIRKVCLTESQLINLIERFVNKSYLQRPLNIRSVLLEMVERPDLHFKQREYQRLGTENHKPDTTDFPKGHIEFEKEVRKYIQFLRNLQVNTKINFQIRVKAPTRYISKIEEKGITNITSGNYIFIFTKSNTLDTIYFGDWDKYGYQVDIHIDMEDLVNFVQKKGVMTIEENDIKKLKSLDYRINPPRKINPPKPKEVVVELYSEDKEPIGKFVIDKKNNIIYKKNRLDISFDLGIVADEGKLGNIKLDNKSLDKIIEHYLEIVDTIN